jgi:hypothetical protein
MINIPLQTAPFNDGERYRPLPQTQQDDSCAPNGGSRIRWT